MKKKEIRKKVKIIFAQGFLSSSEQKKLAKEVYDEILRYYTSTEGEVSLEKIKKENKEKEETIKECWGRIDRAIKLFQWGSQENSFSPQHLQLKESNFKLIENINSRDPFSSVEREYVLGNENYVTCRIYENDKGLCIKEVKISQKNWDSILKDSSRSNSQFKKLTENLATILSALSQRGKENGKKVYLSYLPSSYEKSFPNNLLSQNKLFSSFRTDFFKQSISKTPPQYLPHLVFGAGF